MFELPYVCGKSEGAVNTPVEETPATQLLVVFVTQAVKLTLILFNFEHPLNID